MILTTIKEWFGRWRTNRMTGTGVALLRLGHYDRALESLGKAIERDPNSHLAWTAKGLTLAKLGKDRMAIQAYERALRLSPPEKERAQLMDLLQRSRDKVR